MEKTTKPQAEVVCPHCHQVFTVNESEYANLLNQISKHEIEQEVHEKLALAEKAKAKEIELACAEVREELNEELAKKAVELTQVESNAERKIADLKARSAEEVSALKTRSAEELAALKSQNTEEIAALQAKLERAETEQELAVSKAVADVKNKCVELTSALQNKETEHKLLESTLTEKYESALRSQDEKYRSELRGKDEMIAYYKDLKARMSTKMIGESLEQHCETQFNQLRATAFQRAYFEKDNEVSRSSGSKGDYIYREYDEHGNEIISIMFEMKNENETTATKHKNEDFLKELDKDRQEKKCEYAILVSMLEADSELYNTGIVDVSHRFDKMYVIRPQFFIPIITILRNAALNSLQYKAELAEVREQNIDITDFENRIEDWKTSFSINSERATKNFLKAIKEIEDSIKKLENTRDALQQTIKNFNTAGNKLDDLSIKRLTRGNPTMTAKFAELKQGKE